MLKQHWRALWNPDMFHGWGKTKNYFEGWYFKIVSKDQKYAFAFIPGISIDREGAAHAFIQVMDGINNKSQYHRFDSDKFIPSQTTFDTQVDNNRFSKNEFHLNLDDIVGTINLSDHIDWPQSTMAPGIMGWYSFVPFMQCNHGIVSIWHKLSGSLRIKGEKVDFTNGIGYIEKDWGSSFPQSYIWMHSNHFQVGSSAKYVMASVAHIPWLGNYFIGFLVGFYWNGVLHQFTSYNGSKMKIAVEDEKVFLTFSRKSERLELIGFKKSGTNLISPVGGAMTGKIEESLQSKIAVSLYINDKLEYEDMADMAGLEMVGDFTILG